MTRGQAVAVMRTINALLVESTDAIRQSNLSLVEVENESYLYSNHLSELKNELQLHRQTETASLKSMFIYFLEEFYSMDQSFLFSIRLDEVDVITRELESLNQKSAEKISNLKSDVAMDLNNHKTEGRDIGEDLQQYHLSLKSI
jgi:hypothetical protein